VILVREVDQLPAVGPGSVLADLIAANVLPIVRLGPPISPRNPAVRIFSSHVACIEAGETTADAKPMQIGASKIFAIPSQ
jgi:ATP-dependent exoDNAse (exonuclease V) alpha subunit